MNKTIRNGIKEVFLTHCDDDCTCLHTLYCLIHEAWPEASQDMLQKETLGIVHELLLDGSIVVLDMSKPGNKDTPRSAYEWKCHPDDAVCRIEEM